MELPGFINDGSDPGDQQPKRSDVVASAWEPPGVQPTIEGVQKTVRERHRDKLRRLEQYEDGRAVRRGERHDAAAIDAKKRNRKRRLLG